MIFYFKTAQNLVADHDGRNFDMIFHFMVAQKLGWNTLKEDRLTGLALKAMNNRRANIQSGLTHKKTEDHACDRQSGLNDSAPRNHILVA